jgi:hypothetical protein
VEEEAVGPLGLVGEPGQAGVGHREVDGAGAADVGRRRARPQVALAEEVLRPAVGHHQVVGLALAGAGGLGVAGDLLAEGAAEAMSCHGSQARSESASAGHIVGVPQRCPDFISADEASRFPLCTRLRQDS